MAALGLGTYGAHVFKPENPSYKQVQILSFVRNSVDFLTFSYLGFTVFVLDFVLLCLNNDDLSGVANGFSLPFGSHCSSCFCS